jgi:tRNA A37 N6-isopentenylltransferase MiaA
MTRFYNQWKHRKAAARRFAKVQSKWLHNVKQHTYTCNECKAVLPSLKKVFGHRCEGKAPAPAEDVKAEPVKA